MHSNKFKYLSLFCICTQHRYWLTLIVFFVPFLKIISKTRLLISVAARLSVIGVDQSSEMVTS